MSRREREQCYHSQHSYETKVKKAKINVQHMKDNSQFGNHYQLDPKAVGFTGMHVVGKKAKVFTMVSFQDIRSCLRNLRGHKEEQPYKSNISSLSSWCLEVGKSSESISKHTIFNKLKSRGITAENTVNFQLVVDKIYDIIFEIIEKVPLQRFRQSGRYNQWTNNLSPRVRNDFLSNYNHNMRKVPNSSFRYFDNHQERRQVYSPRVYPNNEGLPVCSRTSNCYNKRQYNSSSLPRSGPRFINNVNGNYEKSGVTSDPASPQVCNRGLPPSWSLTRTYGSKSINNLGKIGWNKTVAQGGPFNSSLNDYEQKSGLTKKSSESRNIGWIKKPVQAENKNEEVNKPSNLKDTFIEETSFDANTKIKNASNFLSIPMPKGLPFVSSRMNQDYKIPYKENSKTNLVMARKPQKSFPNDVKKLKSYNLSLQEQLYDLNIAWEHEQGLPIPWRESKGGSHILQIKREDACKSAINTAILELRKWKKEEKLAFEDDDDDDDSDVDTVDSRSSESWEGCPYSSKKRKGVESEYMDEDELRLALKIIFEKNLVWDIGFQMLVYAENGGGISEGGLWKEVYCPCSKMFKSWRKKEQIDNIICKPCKKSSFKEVNLFIQHVQSKAEKEDPFHVGIWHYIHFMYKDYIKVTKKSRIENSVKSVLTKNSIKVRNKKEKCVLTLPTIGEGFYDCMETFIVQRENNHDEMNETFATINLFEINNHLSLRIYEPYWNICSYIQTFNNVRRSGTYMNKSQRGIPMYLFGSTIGATRYPLYYKDGKYHNLPRPYADYRPGSSARRFTDTLWFTTFVQEIERCVIYFLRHKYPNKRKAKITLFEISQAKHVIPEACRISGTFFNHMTFLGNLDTKGNDSIDLHKDTEDIITALFHVGKPIEGGSTMYYSGDSKTDPGKLMNTIHFEHGRIQIGYFNDVLHAADSWKGLRGGINFNLKKNILRFFQNDELSQYYTKYENHGFIDKNYIAI